MLFFLMSFDTFLIFKISCVVSFNLYNDYHTSYLNMKYTYSVLLLPFSIFSDKNILFSLSASLCFYLKMYNNRSPIFYHLIECSGGADWHINTPMRAV